jgi:RNA polymerase sigma-70 factor (ECF subfamily)
MSPTERKCGLLSPLAASPQFRTTHWSVVRQAGGTTTPDVTLALEKLCRTYWLPLYAYIRRRGYGPEEAEDLTQEFFARLLAGDGLSGIDRSKGKFRSFLLAAVNNLLANEWDRANAAKRGGNLTLISFDDETAEGHYHLEPASAETPEKLFDRSCLRTLLSQALISLRAEFSAVGKAAQFEQLKGFLTEDTGDGEYSAVAEFLQMSTGAVAAAVCRMRRRYRELFRAEISRTVTTPVEVEEEIRHLLAALS